MKKILIIPCLLLGMLSQAQQLAPLTVEKIMRDPKWIGTSPENYQWSADSKTLFFDWNPENKAQSSTYKLSIASGQLSKSSPEELRKSIAPNYVCNKNKSLALFEKGGDIFLKDLKTDQERRLTQTIERESSARFLADNRVVYQQGDNLFSIDLAHAQLSQLTHFIRKKEEKPLAKTKASEQDTWLQAQQLELFDVLKNKPANKARSFAWRNFGTKEKSLKPIYLGDERMIGWSISPDGQYINYVLVKAAEQNKGTIIPNYLSRSGYTEDIAGRTKVGENPRHYRSFMLHVGTDSVFEIDIKQIPGIKDIPEYVKDYPKQLAELQKEDKNRLVQLGVVNWSETGQYAILVARAQDNKDFWILQLDPANGQLSLIDRQHDEAWIGGPGIGREPRWIDPQRFYFQSEATGYSHLYTYNMQSREKKQLTSGNWEVQSVQLAKDKKSFYLSGNKSHPGITHFYKIDVNGGSLQQLTQMKGGNEVLLSPDEKWLAINYSYINQPWELYLQANKAGAKAKQITQSSSKEFSSYAWQEPDIVSFKNRYGDDIYARVYPAKKQLASKPAVVFVHGAGYLQNVHFWWSQYFREYMFHNLLADKGYTVIDIDYTASSGYGRKHRTGIYRHMGGKDLSDQVDGAAYLVKQYGVNPKNIGIYGGSYGGYITLMALFKEGDTFKSGAALRSVTDWAHYNQGYTANILNEPTKDPEAYKRSSPIYFANGLKGNLLMCHGMVDVNVHFQDIVRLSQRLIELGKDNWELAVYPVEDHGFTTASSWTDEYKRILKLFEHTLNN